jgi:predicted MFS family arabinose efflux permease
MQHQRLQQILPGPDLIPGIACMLHMFQAYLVAPLIPSLAKEFNSSSLDLAVPAFAIPFALAAAAMVFFKPEVELRKSLLISLGALCLGSYLLSMARSAPIFLLIRVLTGLGTGAMLPSALLLAIQPDGKRRSLKAMVPIIFAVAAGMTFGPSLGGWLNGVIGWRGLYRCIRTLAILLFLVYLLKERQEQLVRIVPFRRKATALLRSDWKRRYSYSFVYLTGVFHSGVFVWISSYFTTKYGLDEFHIATDLFIFGLPGFVVALFLYRYQLDKKVVTMLYLALGLTIAGLLILMGNLPLWLAECLLGIISIGFGCSQPLFTGLLKLPGKTVSLMRPVAMGSGILFAGYGSGPLMMMALLNFDLAAAMVFLIGLVLAMAYISRRIWKVTSGKAARGLGNNNALLAASGKRG